MKKSRAGKGIKGGAGWEGKAFKQKPWIKEVKPCGHQGEEDSRLLGEEQEQRLEFA